MAPSTLGEGESQEVPSPISWDVLYGTPFLPTTEGEATPALQATLYYVPTLCLPLPHTLN